VTSPTFRPRSNILGSDPGRHDAGLFYRTSSSQDLAAQERGPAATQGVVPVFDRARHDPQTRARLEPFECRRTDRDRKPGKPLPPEATGDPHPDRLAIAEARRLAILAQDNRYRIEGSVDRENIREPRPGPGKGHAGKTPDIETPRSYYIDLAVEDAAIEARRGDQVLYFHTTADAVRCITGERSPKWSKAIQNCLTGDTRQAFGWSWTRLKDARQRRSSRA